MRLFKKKEDSVASSTRGSLKAANEDDEPTSLYAKRRNDREIKKELLKDAGTKGKPKKKWKRKLCVFTCCLCFILCFVPLFIFALLVLIAKSECGGADYVQVDLKEFDAAAVKEIRLSSSVTDLYVNPGPNIPAGKIQVVYRKKDPNVKIVASPSYMCKLGVDGVLDVLLQFSSSYAIGCADTEVVINYNPAMTYLPRIYSDVTMGSVYVSNMTVDSIETYSKNGDVVLSNIVGLSGGVTAEVLKGDVQLKNLDLLNHTASLEFSTTNGDMLAQNVKGTDLYTLVLSSQKGKVTVNEFEGGNLRAECFWGEMSGQFSGSRFRGLLKLENNKSEIKFTAESGVQYDLDIDEAHEKQILVSGGTPQKASFTGTNTVITVHLTKD